MRKKHLSVGQFVNGFFVALLAFICLYPFLNVLAYSVSGYNAVLSGRVTFYPIDFNVDAYKQILGKTQIWLAMKTTVLVTLYGTALSLALTILSAFALSRKDLPGR
ncbi:MAG: ABC transporter permease, partial [Lachnospiraceae bacterium]|nr:ABC transporter permease [Lachnospiraceae bacterium]